MPARPPDPPAVPRRTAARAGRGPDRGALRRSALLALLATLAGLALAGSSWSAAHAENALVSSSPEQGATTSTGLAEILLQFENEVAGTPTVTVVCDNNPVTSDATVGDDQRTVTVALTAAVPEGECNVAWRLFNANGDVDAEGTLSFDVSAGAAAAGTGATPATPAAGTEGGGASVRSASGVSSGPIWFGRVLSTIGVAVLFGSLVLIVAAWPEGPEYVVALRFLRTAWIVGLVGTLIYVVALSAAVRGESFGNGLSPSGWFDLFDAGWPGRAAVMRVVFVLASGWVVMRPERVIDPTTNMLALGIPGLAVVTLGLSRTGGSLAFLGVIASIVHVLAMAVWFGAVVLLARVVLAGPGEEDLVHAVHGFTRLSNPAIVITVVSGVVQLYRQVGGELFSTSHGRVLLLKTVAVAAMIFVGMTAQQLARARLARAHELTARTADRLRRAFGTEAVIGVVVLALTGWMLSLTPGKVPDAGVVGYEVQRPINDTTSGLALEVFLSPGRVGPNDLRVEVTSPETGLNGLTLTFIPPGGSGGIVQAIPGLTGAGSAGTVEGFGLPLDVAGTWVLQVDANTPSGAAQQVQTQFEILQADGSPAPPPPVEPLDPTTTTQPAGPVLTEPAPATTQS